MRLLHLSPSGIFCLTNDLNEDPCTIPRYAILSHTWGSDDSEVNFKDIQDGTARNKSGYAKLEFCAQQARKDEIDYFWIDTCCINKDSDAELSQAIRSMFRWYQNAQKCYVFLSDVSSSKRDANGDSGLTWEKNFRSSRWFTRGWTLQELLAPKIVEFFSRERVLLGSKDSLTHQLHEVTGIPTIALCGKPMVHFSVEQRFAWAEKRRTTKAEDSAYCLFGIFDVQLPVLYGEGEEKALRRLRDEVGVTLAELDRVIWTRYNDGRLNVERLSGKSLPLDYCFINLGIIDHVRDRDGRSTNTKSDQGTPAEEVATFSLLTRLKVETPPQSKQLSLNTLFNPRQQKNKISMRPKRVLIWGRAGMGKTTLCKKIVYEVYRHGLWKDLYERVIWLPLRRLKRIECRNAVELLQHEFPFIGLGERGMAALNKLIQDDRTLFLLDGLDEVSFTLDHDSPTGYVLRDLLSQANLIITSRPHSTYLLDAESLDLTVETVGFFPQQIEEYLQRVGKETDTADKTVHEIRSFIKERPLVQSLAGIPILLDAICYTWNSKKFPQGNATMTVLYGMVAQSLWKNSILRLGKRGDDQRLVTKQQVDYWPWLHLKKHVRTEISFLQELGFWGLCNNIIEFSYSDMETSEILQQVSSDNLVHLLFLRVSDNSVEADDQSFHFIHLTFQELFAAQRFVSSWVDNNMLPLWERTVSAGSPDQLVRYITAEEFLKSNKYIDHYKIFWRFVTGLLLNLPNKAHFYNFINILEGEPMDKIGTGHQRLVIHCLSEVGTCDDELRSRVTKLEARYLRWTLCQSRLKRRWGYTNGSKSLASETEYSDHVMVRLLDNYETSNATLEALSRRQGVSSYMLDILLRKLSKSESQEERSIIIRIVGQNCDQNRRERILELFHQSRGLRTTYEEVVRAWTATRRLLEPAVGVLLGLLQDHQDPHLRTMVATTLKLQAALPPAAIEALVLLLRDPNIALTYGLGEALRARDSLPETAVDALIQQLQDPDQQDFTQVVWALRNPTALSAATVEKMIYLLQNSDHLVRINIIRTFHGQITLPERVIEILVRLLQDVDTDSQINSSIVTALGTQTSLPETALETLTQLVLNPESHVWVGVVRALGNQTIIPKTAVQYLIQRLHDPNCFAKSEVLYALRNQFDLSPTVIELLISFLRNPDTQYLSSEVITVLDKQATLPIAAVEILMQLLQDPELDDELRERLAEALGKQSIPHSMNAERFLPILQNPSVDQSVRCAIISAFYQQSCLPTSVMEALISLLHHSDTDYYDRLDIAAILKDQVTLPSTVTSTLFQILQNPATDYQLRSIVLTTFENQTTFPDTAIETFSHLLQTSDNLTCQRTIRLIINNEKLRATIPTFSASILQQFMKYWFCECSAVSLTEMGCLSIRASDYAWDISMSQEQLKLFKAEWQKARDGLGLPSLTPIIFDV